LSPDDLDSALLRRMELYINQNGYASMQPLVKQETSAPLTTFTLDEQPVVKNESVDVGNKHASEGSSSSDDEVPFTAPSTSGPAPTPSAEVPMLSTPSEGVGSKMPRIIETDKGDDKPGDIQVEASWGSLADEKPREGSSGGFDVNPLWSEFQNRTAQQQLLEKEKEEREQAHKQAQLQQIEEQRRLSEEAEAREREESARKDRENEEELARKREEARAQREQMAPQVDLLEQSNIMKEFQQSLNQQ